MKNIQQIIREILMEYTDPKLEKDGMTAWELAGIILKEIKKNEKPRTD